MHTTESRGGRFALMVGHCAGMVDLVALPVWVGALISRYGLDPQRAGGLATLFLLGAVASSIFFAPRLHRLNARRAAALGFGAAGLAFAATALTDHYGAMALLHAAGGLAAGCALSVTHGTIACSSRPHRLFAIVGMALGVFAIVFLGSMPKVIATFGGPALFWSFGAVMLFASLVCALAFPNPADGGERSTTPVLGKLPAGVWFGILGVACMGLVQAMMFAFLERIGAERGFSAAAITGVFIALGFVNLFPAALAALLEHRWDARKVVLAGPVVQALLALLMSQSVAFAPYAGAAMFFAAVMIFTHTFAFGLLARLDASGRALAATPAMVMTGAAIGPILGGTLVKFAGYGSLGLAAVVIAAVAVFCFAHARVRAQALPAA